MRNSPASDSSSMRVLTELAPDAMDSTSSVLFMLPFSRTTISAFIACFLSRTSSSAYGMTTRREMLPVL